MLLHTYLLSVETTKTNPVFFDIPWNDDVIYSRRGQVTQVCNGDGTTRPLRLSTGLVCWNNVLSHRNSNKSTHKFRLPHLVSQPANNAGSVHSWGQLLRHRMIGRQWSTTVMSVELVPCGPVMTTTQTTEN